MTAQDFMWLAIGLASLLAAIGIVIACARLAALLGHANETLRKLDRQLDEADPPLVKTLTHVSGVAESIDAVAARANRIAEGVEKAASAVAKTADAAQAAVTPTVANIVGIAVGVSQGAKTFFRSRGRDGFQDKQ
jgi:uncharacterized protein YoxC